MNVGRSNSQLLGEQCCADIYNCRHAQLFRNLEPYSDQFLDDTNSTHYLYKVKGVPLIGLDNAIYLGESIQQINKTNHISSFKIIGQSPSALGLMDALNKAALTITPVLLQGETGTGKELAAEYIHNHCQKTNGQFVVVDCTVLNDELFESELFGHEKGSFTGANGTKIGLFEIAKNGTLFLDEIGELPLSQQAKLLRVLDTGQYRKVGGTKMQKTDVRIICATHRNLIKMVEDGLFRQDLLYRLSIFPIKLPTLKERLSDLPLLIDFFLNHFGSLLNSNYRLTKEAYTKLLKHNWPGNIRELKNCLYLSMTIAKDEVIVETDVFIIDTPVTPSSFETTQKSVEITIFENNEVNLLMSLVEKYHGNRRKIAVEMNISERTLYRKLKMYNICN